MPRTPPLPALALLGLGLLLPTIPAPAAAAQDAGPPAAEEGVHPFYAQLLERGIFAFRQGDAEEAARDLRLASFGLLEHPERLVHGLAYLALAQADAGAEAETVFETLSRVISVEERFAVYDRTDLPPDVRRRVAELMVARVPEETLARSATFSPLAEEKLLRRLREMPPRQRRDALEARVAEEPDSARWRTELAELELAAGRTEVAAAHAAAALAAAPGNTAARCVRGLALAEEEGCGEAIPHLEACPRTRDEPEAAWRLADCQARLGHWRQALGTLRELPPELPRSRALERLQERVERRVAELETPPQPPESDSGDDAGTAVPSAPTPGTGSASGDGGESLPPEDRETLRHALRLTAAAERAGDLEEPLTLARGVANAHPASTEAQHTAAEIAYRASRWGEAAHYFRRGGLPERPVRRFYMAVALFESGEPGEAAQVLETALPSLPESPFVSSYVERIQAAAGEETP